MALQREPQSDPNDVPKEPLGRTAARGELGGESTPASKPRVRRWAAKAVTGCFCCRARRVKCGEEKPRCRRCVKRGDDCAYPWYGAARAASPATAKPGHVQPALATPAGPPGTTSSSLDRQLFYMFRLDTAEKLGGWSDAGFWSGDVPRASQVYPAMWHANLALVAATWSQREAKSDALKGDASQRWSIVAAQHYGKAMRALLQTTTKEKLAYRDKESLIITEALLVGVNSMSGQLEQAAKHATSAVLLFDTWRFQLPQGERRGEAVMRKASLVTLITALRSQMVTRCTAEDSTTTMMMRTMTQDDLGRGLDQMPASPFHDLTQAYEAVVPLYVSTMRGAQRVRAAELQSTGEAYFATHRAALATWRAKLADLKQARPPQTPAERFGFLVMRIHAVAIEACLAGDASQGALMWDWHAPACYAVLESLERWVEEQGGQSHDALFSFSVSISESVYWICLGCYDYGFRRRAVKLLHAWNVCDGLWDTRLVAAIIDVYMETENRSGEVAGVQTCALHRIVGSHIAFVGPREAIFGFQTAQDRMVGAPWRSKVLRY